MKEYIIALTKPPESTLILAINVKEAYEIAYERFGRERVVQIVLYTPIKKMQEAIGEPLRIS